MSGDDGSDIIFLHDNISYNGDRIAGGTAREVSKRIELDLAYSSEKVSNLELLVMQVANQASDYEILTSGSEEILTESIEKAFQFDILSGFLNSELKEIESFMSNLQLNIIAAHKKFTESDDNLEESLSEIEAKLNHAEESLRNSQDQVADIRKQSNKFEKLLAFGIPTDVDLENGNCSSMSSKWNLQSVEQQRHFLLSFENSLAREMDLEKKLSELRCNEKELKMKLHFAEQDAYCSEDLVEVMMERVLAAENTAEFLLGNSKEFMRELQNDQLCSSTSTPREWEENSNMEKAILKLSSEEVDNKFIAASSEVSSLRVTVNQLEDQLRKSEPQLQFVKASVTESNNQQNIPNLEENNMENVIKGLRENVAEIQCREDRAEARCTQLMKANVELADEVGFLRNTNLELNEELSFLRGRLESLEASLHQADKVKVATAMEIGNRSRYIVELVKKLALERDHPQLQVDEPIRSAIFERKVDPAVLAEDSMAAVPNIEIVRTIEATQLNWKYIFMAFIVFLVSLLAVSLFST